MNVILKDYSSKSSVRYLLMTDFVKEIDWEICEPVCNRIHNLISFLKNCHGVSINFPHFLPCGLHVDKKE
jgi:hypothetical protein